MEIRVKINIVNDQGEPFMGPGPLRLLQRVHKYNSINRAAKDMKLSYVKALRMLSRLEEDAGQKLLIKSRGGNERGGTRLTPYGEIFMAEYKRLQEFVGKRADTEFKKFEERLRKKVSDEDC